MSLVAFAVLAAGVGWSVATAGADFKTWTRPEMAVPFGALAVASALMLATGLITGQVKRRSRRADRATDPRTYWIRIANQALVCSVATGAAAWLSL